MGVSKNRGIPNPTKMDDLGVALFFGNTHIRMGGAMVVIQNLSSIHSVDLMIFTDPPFPLRSLPGPKTSTTVIPGNRCFQIHVLDTNVGTEN